MMCGSKSRKVGSLKRRVPSQLARWEMDNCTPLWCEAHFEVKMYKTHHSRTTFGSWGVEKAHAVVARSTIRSQNVQSTPFSDHFWKLRCRKSARGCGTKHISKSKCTKHTIVGPLLEVEMSKKCTWLWHEAHFQVKMYKTHHCRTTFDCCDVEKVHAVVARSTFPRENIKNTILGQLLDVKMSFRVAGARDCGSCQKWAKREGFVAFSTTTTTLHHTTLQYTTTTTTPSLHSTTLHSTTLHCTQLHSNTHSYTTLHYTTLHYIPLHYTTLHYTTLHWMTLHHR